MSAVSTAPRPPRVRDDRVDCHACGKKIAERWGAGTRITCRHCSAVNE